MTYDLSQARTGLMVAMAIALAASPPPEILADLRCRACRLGFDRLE